MQAVKKRTKELDAGAAHLRSMLSGHLGPDFEQVTRFSDRDSRKSSEVFDTKAVFPTTTAVESRGGY